MGAKDFILIGLMVVSLALLFVQIPMTNGYIDQCALQVMPEKPCSPTGQFVYMGVLLGVAVVSAAVLWFLSRNNQGE